MSGRILVPIDLILQLSFLNICKIVSPIYYKIIAVVLQPDGRNHQDFDSISCPILSPGMRIRWPEVVIWVRNSTFYHL